MACEYIPGFQQLRALWHDEVLRIIIVRLSDPQLTIFPSSIIRMLKSAKERMQITMSHASGFLREHFLEMFEKVSNVDDLRKNEHEPLFHICGKLWNCTDIIPRSDAEKIEDVIEGAKNYRIQIWSYCQEARRLRELFVRLRPDYYLGMTKRGKTVN